MRGIIRYEPLWFGSPTCRRLFYDWMGDKAFVQASVVGHVSGEILHFFSSDGILSPTRVWFARACAALWFHYQGSGDPIHDVNG